MYNQLVSYLTSNKITIAKLSLLIIFALLLHFKHLNFIAEKLNMAALHQQNQTYLDSARALATTDILHLSELLAVTEVARSSDVGVSFFASFNVDVGNILFSFSSLLEQGIDVLLASLSAIEFLALLDSFASWSSPFLFKVVIISAVAFYTSKLLLVPKKALTKTHSFYKLSASIFLFAYIALPYSIHLSSFVSHELTQNKRQDISTSLKNTHGELVISKKGNDLKDNAEASLHHLKKMPRKHITHKVSNLSTHIFTSISLNIFDLLVMPLLLLFLLNKFCLKMVSLVKNDSEVAG